jgi:hypothetical protein
MFQRPLTLTLMMETEGVSETLVFNSDLTWLFTREENIAFIRHESFKSSIDLCYVYVC